MKYILIFIIINLCGCSVYTEKRSEALSQAVFATAESIKNARFDKAGPYAEQAKRLAYPPKKQLSVPPIITSSTKKTYSPNKLTDVKIISNSIEDDKFLRLVIPESLKHSKLLIENSEEWNELLKTKQFKDQLEVDNANLKQLANDIDVELQKQMKYNNQMVIDLNNMQKKLVEKDLLITRLYITIVVLIISIAGGIYLRIKGIL